MSKYHIKCTDPEKEVPTLLLFNILITLPTGELPIYNYIYKADEFVCVFECANVRNYWFDLIKCFCDG